jgi:hypothetical protein
MIKNTTLKSLLKASVAATALLAGAQTWGAATTGAVFADSLTTTLTTDYVIADRCAVITSGLAGTALDTVIASTVSATNSNNITMTAPNTNLFLTTPTGASGLGTTTLELTGTITATSGSKIYCLGANEILLHGANAIAGPTSGSASFVLGALGGTSLLKPTLDTKWSVEVIGNTSLKYSNATFDLPVYLQAGSILEIGASTPSVGIDIAAMSKKITGDGFIKVTNTNTTTFTYPPSNLLLNFNDTTDKVVVSNTGTINNVRVVAASSAGVIETAASKNLNITTLDVGAVGVTLNPLTANYKINVGQLVGSGILTTGAGAGTVCVKDTSQFTGTISVGTAAIAYQ